MAKIYGDIAASALMTFDKSFSRSNGQPLDSTEIFYSLDAAKAYAKTAVAYVGQEIAVVDEENNSVKRYVIQNAAGDLSAVGVELVGDGQSIEVVDGKVRIVGFAAAVEGSQPRKKADGTIEWVKPDTTTVDGLGTAVEGLTGDLGDLAERVDVIEADYLKDADKQELVQAIATAKQEAIEAVLDGVSEDYDTLKEVAAWIQSDTTNSSALIARISDIEKDYLKAADKTELQGGIDALAEFVGALPEGAVSKNVVDYIQEAITGLKIGDYAKLADLNTLAGRVDDVEEALGDKVDKVEGKQLSTEDFTTELKEKLEGMDATAAPNVIEIIKANGVALPIVDKAVNIPGATQTVLGMVKGSAAENQISIKDDFTMEINSLNINKLVQTEGDVLILDGGGAVI